MSKLSTTLGMSSIILDIVKIKKNDEIFLPLFAIEKKYESIPCSMYSNKASMFCLLVKTLVSVVIPHATPQSAGCVPPRCRPRGGDDTDGSLKVAHHDVQVIQHERIESTLRNIAKRNGAKLWQFSITKLIKEHKTIKNKLREFHVVWLPKNADCFHKVCFVVLCAHWNYTLVGNGIDAQSTRTAHTHTHTHTHTLQLTSAT